VTDALTVAGAVLLILPEKVFDENTERLLPLVLRQDLYGRIEVSKKFHPVQDSNSVIYHHDPHQPMRTQLTIWCILLLHMHAAARQAPYSFRTININHGLSQNSVIDIATDEKGFLWFATQDGLNRFDGKEFAVFWRNFDDITTKAYSHLGKIIPGNNHDLWLITKGGKVEKFNLLNDSFTHYKKLSPNITLPPVSCLYQETQGALWIGTIKEGLYYHDTVTRQTIHFTRSSNQLNSDSVQFLLRSRNKTYWVLTSNGINAITPGRTATTRFLYSTTAPYISCSVMDEDEAGNLWAGTYAKGVYLKRPQDTTFTPFTGFNPQQTLPSNLVVQTIRTDQDGQIWIGTFGGGLYIINMKEATVHHIMPEEGNTASLSYVDILCIQRDKLGGIWIGTDGGGVSLYDKRLNMFSMLTKSTVQKNIPIEQVRSITTDDKGGIWIGTSSSGLSYVDNRNDRSIKPIDLTQISAQDNRRRIVSLRTDSEDTWIGMQDNGLLIMNSHTRTIKAIFSPQGKGKYYLPDHTIWTMLPVNSQQAWLGTRNAGLCLLDKKQGLLKSFNKQLSGIIDNNVRSITAINDTLLCLGFETKGIQFFNTRTEEFTFLSHPTALQQLSQKEYTLKCTSFQPPYLWIGTLGNGIIIFDTATGKTFPITDKNGLPNNTIYSILPDKQGAIWMSSNKGIIRFKPPTDLQNTNRTHFSEFTAEDGLQGNEFNTGAYHADANGILYFGGSSGMNWFDPMKYSGAHPAAPVVITGIAINNEPLKSDTAITYKERLQLAWHQNSLSFTFAALDFVAPRKIKYYYQLYPYDKNWIEAGNRNYAAYTNIPPGTYTFRVKAWEQIKGATVQDGLLTIIITPPFWKTWWFVALLILALATLLYLLYRYRINQLIALQKVRNRIATDLHDDIGSTLTNISILSELSRQKLGQQEEAGVFLSRITEEVTNSSQALDDIVWSINTNNDTLEQTVARMRRYAAEIFDGANIHYTLLLDEYFAQRKLNMEQRRDCFLLFKEVINNIYKHADAKNVLIRLWIERQQLYMIIEDDGRGFDVAQTTHRNGLKNIQQRVGKWGGRIEIVSSKGKGTAMQINFPIV
jgi:signal transduction histidine kinase/ligand-binding sensor domain-containing protein